MTKQGLLNLLKEKFTKVLAEKQVGEPEEGITHWAVPVFDKVSDILIRQWVHFYTDAEGNAYWQDREPKPTPGSDPSAQLRQYINSKIADGTIEGANIDLIDAINETAIVRVWMGDPLEEKRLFVDRDDSGKLRYRVIA